MTAEIYKLIDTTNNCKHWDGITAAREAIDRVTASKLPVKKLIIMWYEPKENGESDLKYTVAGLSREEHIAMLQTFLYKAIQNLLG